MFFVAVCARLIVDYRRLGQRCRISVSAVGGVVQRGLCDAESCEGMEVSSLEKQFGGLVWAHSSASFYSPRMHGGEEIMRYRLTTLALLTAALLSAASTSVEAGIGLELRPASQGILAGQTVEIDLYVTGASPSEPVGLVRAVLAWDPAYLELVGNDRTGEPAWASSGFPTGGLNADWSDGRAMYLSHVSLSCVPIDAPPEGQFVTTLLFEALGNFDTTFVNILASQDTYETQVYDNLVGLCGGVMYSSVTLGSAVNVTISACNVAVQCNDADACTDDTCDGGVCVNTINYDDETQCCNPTSGTLTVIDDGDDCTDDECDPATGTVSHDPTAFGTPCGDPTDDFCTDPDTCDGAGYCDPHHATDNTWCNVDGDECTTDRCQSGICVTISTLANGTFCDDGQDNCTPGQDECLDGVCVGTGTDPCPAIEPDTPYCYEAEVTADACTGGDGDCDTAKEFYCFYPNGDECPSGDTTCVCQRAFECRECLVTAHCPDDGSCYAPVCYAGECIGHIVHERCLDDVWCNGEEFCQNQATPPAQDWQCVSDNYPPCSDPDFPVCVEETCCIGEDCSKDYCECFECDEDEDCDDGDPCTGVETCDPGSLSCLPGTPVDCSAWTDDCYEGVCDPDIPGCSGTDCCWARVWDMFTTPCDNDTDCASYPHTTCNLDTHYCWGPANACEDGDPCTFLDTCTHEGACIGFLRDYGPIDYVWYADDTEVSVDDYVYLELKAAPNDGGDYQPSVFEAVLAWDPTVLELLGVNDPCTTAPIPAGCTRCETHADCDGTLCQCEGGPPCLSGGEVPQPSGICLNGLYEWFSEGLATGPSDPDGLNDDWSDGDAYYLALGQLLYEDPPVFDGEPPLWLTTFVFQAVGYGDTDVELISCTGDWPTESQILANSTHSVGELPSVEVSVVECYNAGDCDDTEVCTEDSCVAGACVYDPIPGCCHDAGDCDDSADCTADTCVPGTPYDHCAYEDLCTDNGLFCDGVELCDVGSNSCVSSGDPCAPFDCDEVTDTCDVTCEPPLVESVGSRYLAITAQPRISAAEVSFRVTSPDWACLDKYVGGVTRCAAGGNRCFSDAECNYCDGPYGGPCTSDADCKTCGDPGNTPCEDSLDCPAGGYVCEQNELCVITGDTCEPTSPLDTVDIDGDGLVDGVVAGLVSDPADAASLTPQEWGTQYLRCSVSFDPCVVDGDCDVGKCSISEGMCSICGGRL